ncbi:MAG: hypothetical protein ACHQ9S_26280 [Candidatus Binatia bacterium]
MPIEFPAAKGLAEALQPIVRFPTLLRVILPGTLATVLCLPVTNQIGWGVIIHLVSVIVIGWLISCFSDRIYQVYEGRWRWPDHVFDWLQARHTARICKLQKQADAARLTRPRLYAEIWNKLRTYPLNDSGKRYASHPTRLGNILAEYETYPHTRYGMDSVFYFPRLWLQIDKDQKTEIDGAWSVADGLLSLSAISNVGGILYLLAGILRVRTGFPVRSLASAFGTSAPGGYEMVLDGSTGWIVAGAFLLAVGYGFYRLSLPFHIRNGASFKALFDLYRDRLYAMTSVGPNERAVWQGTWSYLQYLRIHCQRCGLYFLADQNQCTHCGYPAEKSLDTLRRTPAQVEPWRPS